MRSISRSLLLVVSVLLFAAGTAQGQQQINPATQIRWPIGCQTGNESYVLSVNQCLQFVRATGDTMSGPLVISMSAPLPPYPSGLWVKAGGTPATIALEQLDAGTDLKSVNFHLDTNGELYLDMTNDAGTAGSNAMTCTRNGWNTTGCQFPGGVSSSAPVTINLNGPTAGEPSGLWIEGTAVLPTLAFEKLDAATDVKSWNFHTGADGTLYLNMTNDAGTAGSNAMTCTRSAANTTGCQFPGGLQDNSGSTGTLGYLPVAQGGGPWLWSAPNAGTLIKWPSTCTPGLVYSPAQNVCVSQGGSANNPALPVGSLQKNGGTNFAPASAQDIGTAISGPNQNYIVSNTVPTVGWPIPSNLGISNDLIWGTNAAQSIGNYTIVTHLGTASSGSTAVTLDSGTNVVNYMNVSGAGIATGTTVSSISGTALTLSTATTAPLSSTSLNFTPGNTGSLIAIGNSACQSCQDNNGSVVIGQGALQNDVGYGTGGEDQNGVFIGPFAGSGETGYATCSTGPAGASASTFEPVIIGNKVGGTGCGWSATQMIGNHIYQMTGATNSTLIGAEIGGALPANVWVVPSGVVGIGRNLFNPPAHGAPAPAAGTYNVSNSVFLGYGNGMQAFNTSYNFVLGVSDLNGPNNGTLITGSHNDIFGDGIGDQITTASQNVLIGGQPGSGSSTASAITTGSSNVIVGNGAGQALSTANLATIVGAGAGISQVSNGMDAFGTGACNSATGASNVCIGSNAGRNITTGTNNVIVGVNNAAGTGPVGAGSSNTMMGSTVGTGESSSNNSYFGMSAGRRSPTASLGSNEAFGISEFQASSGSTGTEQYDVFVGDSSNCNGCTNVISLGHTANLGSVTHAIQLDTGTNNTSHTMQWQSVNFLDDAGNATFKTEGVQSVPTIASAATIAPTSTLIKISGTAAITTITPPTVAQNGGVWLGCIKVIPTGAFTTTTGGNIAMASTAIVNRVIDFCFGGTQWFPSY